MLQMDFPFLEEEVFKVRGNHLPFYLLMFPPRLAEQHPTLAFLGFIQPLGAIQPIVELQARLAALVFKVPIEALSTSAITTVILLLLVRVLVHHYVHVVGFSIFIHRERSVFCVRIHCLRVTGLCALLWMHECRASAGSRVLPKWSERWLPTRRGIVRASTQVRGTRSKWTTCSVWTSSRNTSAAGQSCVRICNACALFDCLITFRKVMWWFNREAVLHWPPLVARIVLRAGHVVSVASARSERMARRTFDYSRTAQTHRFSHATAGTRTYSSEGRR